MKLDPTVMRTMNSQDFRVLEAVEKGMKNHALVPIPLINSIANLRNGGTHKIISSLLRDKLLSHERKKSSYDGYRLTNAGYDILALHNLKKRGFIAALGQRIGTGKESDIYLAANPEGQQIVLKFHRLGRTSFRNVKQKRDYFGRATQQAHSWLFLSRLSALKEYAFMKALYDVKYPTPTPVAQNRHIVAMSLVRGLPLYQIYPKQLSVHQAADIYDQAIRLAARLAQHGLVHCDLNEFNLLVDLSGIQSIATDAAEDPYVRHSGQSVAEEKSMGALSKPAWEQSLEANDRIHEAIPEPAARLENGEPKPVVTLIDFPQMISMKHFNAKELYERDLACLRRFFEMKLQCNIPEEQDEVAQWELVSQTLSTGEGEMTDTEKRLDSELRASGFSEDMGRGLELYYFDSRNTGGVEAVVDEALDEEDQSRSEESCSDSEQKGALHEKDNDDNNELPSALDELGGVELDDDTTEQVEALDLLDFEQMQSISHEKMVERAKERVRRQLDDQRRKARKKGAFKSRNSNKTYIKGKRVMNEFGL